jgi:hypothetical protein
VSLWKAASYAISTRLSFLTMRVHPLPCFCRCSGECRCALGISRRLAEYQPTRAVDIFLSCNCKSRFVGCHDRWRPRCGVLRTVRQPPLLSSLDSYSSIPYWHRAILHESRGRRYPKRIPLDLGSRRSVDRFGLVIAHRPSRW